jgi:hypothetical protein
VDSVIGSRGGKVLTIYFTAASLMLAYIRDTNTAKSVIDIFDGLTQEDVTKMMDHINSYRRKKLNNRSPYEAFRFYYGEELLQKLGCHEVPTNSIILKPALLRK